MIKENNPILVGRFQTFDEGNALAAKLVEALGHDRVQILLDYQGVHVSVFPLEESK